MLMRLVLWLDGTLVAKSYEVFFNVVEHAEVEIAFLVVPIKGQAKVTGAFPVGVI